MKLLRKRIEEGSKRKTYRFHQNNAENLRRISQLSFYTPEPSLGRPPQPVWHTPAAHTELQNSLSSNLAAALLQARPYSNLHRGKRYLDGQDLSTSWPCHAAHRLLQDPNFQKLGTRASLPTIILCQLPLLIPLGSVVLGRFFLIRTSIRHFLDINSINPSHYISFILLFQGFPQRICSHS